MKADARNIPPYGPSQGMLRGLQLLQRITPSRVDEAFFRTQGVAPGNEYKVVGALRFLGLIDDEGKPTERCRLLKTRGATFILALQETVRQAYGGLFRRLRVEEATREGIYNYFVGEMGLGAEMATKAARFFIDLCRFAEIPLAATAERPRGRAASVVRLPQAVVTSPRRRRDVGGSTLPAEGGFSFPLVITLTPELAALEEDQLAGLLAKMRRAWQKAQVEDSPRKEA